MVVTVLGMIILDIHYMLHMTESKDVDPVAGGLALTG
jgi:hypothetical protein